MLFHKHVTVQVGIIDHIMDNSVQCLLKLLKHLQIHDG